MEIRAATPDDAEGICAIYAPMVAESFATFETEAPTADEMRTRVRETTKRFPWLVADEGKAVAGYAYATRHHERAAYQWCVNVSVYVHSAHRGRGVGARLYRELFDRLRAKGFVNAYAGIALPNDASTRLHESLGFVRVATYPRVGYKLGAWRDVGWWHLLLREPPEIPEPPATP